VRPGDPLNTLLANCVIFHTALDMTTVLRQLAAEGWEITPAAMAALSPYIRERIKRFGEYATDGLIDPSDADARGFRIFVKREATNAELFATAEPADPATRVTFCPRA
jgi:hypothetical protein